MIGSERGWPRHGSTFIQPQEHGMKPSDNRPTIAHLGCGGRGREHLRALIDPRSGVRLVGVCDQHDWALDQARGFLPAEVPVFRDAEAMLRAAKPGIVSFVTPPQARLPLLDLAIRHGARAVVYEKPMSTTLAEARELVARADAAGVLSVVSHQHKYAAHWLAVKGLIDSGELGRVREIQVAAKGWMLHYASHLIDYATWLNGGHAPVRMAGFAGGRGKLDDNHPSPDYVLGRCEFANGVRGIIECGAFAPDQEPELAANFWMNAGATVIGTEGVAQVLVGAGWQAVTARCGRHGSRDISFDGVADSIPLYAELAACLADPARKHSCRSEVALIGHEAMLAMVASAIERRTMPVPLPPQLGYEPLARLAELLPAEPLAAAAAG
jgi:predicted dehydrogenase